MACAILFAVLRFYCFIVRFPLFRPARISMFSLSLRMTRRDWRAGELRFLLIALIVAVAALSSVGFFVDRMRAGLVRDAHQLLGADLLVGADQPLRPEWQEQAAQSHLEMAQTVVFPSMAIAGEGDAARSILASDRKSTRLNS